MGDDTVLLRHTHPYPMLFQKLRDFQTKLLCDLC